jgi:hypothetical protein
VLQARQVLQFPLLLAQLTVPAVVVEIAIQGHSHLQHPRAAEEQVALAVEVREVQRVMAVQELVTVVAVAVVAAMVLMPMVQTQALAVRALVDML